MPPFLGNDSAPGRFNASRRLQWFLQFSLSLVTPAVVAAAGAASFDSAARSTNELGLQLYRQLGDDKANLCISPYSVTCALAMALAGADGQTQAEMARVLQVKPGQNLDASFAALQKSLEEMTAATKRQADQAKEHGGPSEPITIAIADRLFPQEGYDFKQDFFKQLKDYYGASPEPVDYQKHADAATGRINDWVAEQTHDRIHNIIPSTLPDTTRLVLANAIYLKAPWQSQFYEGATEPEPFHVQGGQSVPVPTMSKVASLRYAKDNGFRMVGIPYIGGDLQFIVLLPDNVDGLASVKQKLSVMTLANCAKAKPTEVDLHLPKFRLEPPTMALSQQLQALGMKTAFDIPQGSANFARMASPKPGEYLALSEAFHKTFIAVDEKGTEAAAATAVTVGVTSALVGPTPKPIEFKVDRPFLYAIQHVPSGACLFIGRVTDPR